jgi:hypothetical protein
MGLIEGYILFALATTIAALYELFIPVINSLSLTHPEIQVIQHKWITLATFTCITLVVAPMMLLPCIVPSMGERFRKSLWETLVQE